VSSTLLTPRQRECLKLARQGKTAIQIADLLGISEHTVNSYFSDAYRRLGARNRTHAVAEADRLNEFSDKDPEVDESPAQDPDATRPDET
jgi:LuxR family transcriptional regulator of spore coat protein